MIPDLDLQLQVVIKALRDTVMPALDPTNRVAAEQIGLSVATLAMVRSRLPLIGLREWQDLANAIALGQAVSREGSYAAIERALAEGASLIDAARPAPGARVAATRAILSAISTTVREAADGDVAGLMRIIVDGSGPALDLARAWGKSAGFEPMPDDVPELAILLGAAETGGGTA